MARTPPDPAISATRDRVHATARRNIAFLVKSSGVARRTVAERIGKTDTWLRRYLHGEFNARLEDLIDLAAVFDRTLFDILNEPEAPTRGEALLIRNYRALPPEVQRHLELASGLLLRAAVARERSSRGRRSTGAKTGHVDER